MYILLFGARSMWMKKEVWLQDKVTSNIKLSSWTFLAHMQYSCFIAKYKLEVS